MMTQIDVTTWIGEETRLPTGYINPALGSGPFPVIKLAEGSTLQGFGGVGYIAYLRKLAEVATELADELEAPKAAEGES